MMQREQNHRGTQIQCSGLCRDGSRHYERGRQEPVLVLVVFAKETRVEAYRFSKFGFRHNLFYLQG
jgi:hypothetical protein